MAHRFRNTWNDDDGGGAQHASINFSQEWIFNKLFTVCKYQSLLLQLSGYHLNASNVWNPVVATKSFYCIQLFC